MPNLPISQLPPITALTKDAQFAVSQGGTTYRVSMGNISSGALYLVATENITQSGFTSPTSAYTISASTVQASNGISVVDSSKFLVASGGTYNFQFSLQLNKLQGGGAEDIEIWLSKNGTNVDWSNTNITLANNNTLMVAAWNFVEPLNPGDYLELKLNVSSADVVIFSESPKINPTRPGIPSAIITITQI
jgi:hypothetical protein